jgi:uncharacterized protein YrzB (UPF0473 family)
MIFRAIPKKKKWESQYKDVLPFTDRDRVEIIIDSEGVKNLDRLKVEIIVIRNNVFYCKKDFPPNGSRYENNLKEINEVFSIPSTGGDSLSFHCLFVLDDLTFEQNFSFVVEDFPEVVEDDPDEILLAKKDYRKENFKEARRLMEKENSSDMVDKTQL